MSNSLHNTEHPRRIEEKTMSDIQPKRVTIHSGPLVQPLAVDEHT
jgi:hypothetical protein